MPLKHEHDFEWDPSKAASNLQKHQVSFERAAQVFLDENALTIYDAAHSEDEDRWITLGLDRHGIMLVVVHTYREQDAHISRIRLISARRASKNEKKQYLDH